MVTRGATLTAMPKPSRTDHHGHAIVELPGGGEIVPEHFNEGLETMKRFKDLARRVLTSPRSASAPTKSKPAKRRKAAS